MSKVRFLLPFVALFSLLVAACGPLVGAQESTATHPPSATPAPAEPTAAPAPLVSEAEVESFDILILESFPVQIRLAVKGFLPGSCAAVGEVRQQLEGSTFTVTIQAVRPADVVCAEVQTPFEHSVALETAGLPGGEYTVVVNGVSQTFDLPSSEPAPEENGDEALAAFEASLEQALLDRNYEQLQALMGEQFGFAFYRSQGLFNTPAEAVEQLRTSYLGTGTTLEFHSTDELAGVELQAIIDPAIDIASMVYVTGWGLEGQDEAVLFIARNAEGGLYWYGVLIALGGFDGA